MSNACVLRDLEHRIGSVGGWLDGRALPMPLSFETSKIWYGLLREHPDWREELRALLLTQEP